jgi:hypothetical protein
MTDKKGGWSEMEDWMLSARKRNGMDWDYIQCRTGKVVFYCIALFNNRVSMEKLRTAGLSVITSLCQAIWYMSWILFSDAVRRKIHSGFWWVNLKERDHLENLGIDERIILKWVLKEWDCKALAGLIWLNIWASGGIF